MRVPQSVVVYTIEWMKMNMHIRTCYQLAPINFCRQVQISHAYHQNNYVDCVKVVGEGQKGRCNLSATEKERLRNVTMTEFSFDALFE